jgi:hypothetical protein
VQPRHRSVSEKGSPKWLMWQDIQEVKRKLDAINLDEINIEAAF